MIAKLRPHQYQQGFSFFESIIGIVIFSMVLILAGITLPTIFSKANQSPQQLKAASIAQAIMAKVLVSECNSNEGNPIDLGFEHLDNYIGCYGENSSFCLQPYKSTLANFLSIDPQYYRGITANISVVKDNVTFAGASNDAQALKRVDLAINFVGNQYNFSAFKGRAACAVAILSS